LIASGETREAARLRALAALRNYPILGIRTNVPLLIELLEHTRFIAGDIDTGFLDTEGSAIRARLSAAPPVEVMALAAFVRREHAPSPAVQHGSPPGDMDPWSSLKGARVG
jgi:acetyl/propionyl-CoA carboxylase alpha subunit